MKRLLLSIALYLLLLPDLSTAQNLAVDHFWIRVEPGAPEAKILRDAGFSFQEFPSNSSGGSNTQDSPNYTYIHSGQGTANNIVRFHNMYLELIWVDNPEQLAKDGPLMGYTLLNPESTSPIGLGLRHAGLETGNLPFPTESYSSGWMQPATALEIATISEGSSDPAIFVVPRYMRWDTRVEANPEILGAADHQNGVKKVTRVRVFGPGQPSGSPAVQSLMDQGLVEFLDSEDHFIEIEFDDGRSRSRDFRPILPLVIFY